jgi:hypothetical protein
MIGYWNDAKSDILRLLDGRNRPGAEAQDAVTSRLLLGDVVEKLVATKVVMMMRGM